MQYQVGKTSTNSHRARIAAWAGRQIALSSAYNTLDHFITIKKALRTCFVHVGDRMALQRRQQTRMRSNLCYQKRGNDQDGQSDLHSFLVSSKSHKETNPISQAHFVGRTALFLLNSRPLHVNYGRVLCFQKDMNRMCCREGANRRFLFVCFRCVFASVFPYKHECEERFH